MKKLIIFIVFFFLLGGINQSFSNWYGNHAVFYNNPGVTQIGPLIVDRGTFCDQDGDGEPGAAVALNNDPNTLTPHGASPMAVPSSGTMRCLYWDSEPPTVTHNYNYDDTWTNGSSKTITLTPADTGGSGVKETRWCEGSTCNPSTGNLGTSIIKNADYNNTIRFQTWDNAGNVSAIGSFVLKLDNTPPTVTHNYNFDNTWTNGSSKTITLTPADTGGSGVKETRWCEGSTCNPLTGNLGTSLTKYADYDNTIRFQTWDNAGNASTIGSFVLKLDNTPPTGTITYTDGWTNNTTQTVTITTADTGGSGVKNYTVQVRTSINNPGFTTWGARTNLSGCVEIISGTCSAGTLTNHRAYEYRLIVHDVAGNNSGWTYPSPVKTLKIDTTAPTASDLPDNSSIPAHNSNLLATNSQIFTITPSSNGGSPIVRIQGFFENYDDCSSDGFLPRNDSNSISLSINSNIQSATPECDFNLGAGSRTYSFKITYLKDEAGNELGILNAPSTYAGVRTFNYNVYANTTNITTKTVNSSELTSGNIADGTTKNLSITLRDVFGNAIVPASGISRTIDFNWNITNNMFLNQYERSGDKSVYVNKTTESTIFLNTRLSGGPISFNGETSTNGIYTYGFKFYTPTSNQEIGTVSDPGANFIINNLTFDINGSLGNIQNQTLNSWSPITAKFNPLYTTSITGDIRDSGLRDVAVQNSNLNINNTPGGITTGVSNRKTYLEFGGTNSNRFTMKYSKTGYPSTEVSQIGLDTNYGDTTGSLNTLLSLNPGETAPATQQFHLSTHIAYTLDEKNITYNSDIVGKDRYHGISDVSINNQYVKILGQVYSNDNYTEIVEDQDGVDVRRLKGEIDKSSLKMGIRKNVYSFIRNVTTSSSTNPPTVRDLSDFGHHTNNGVSLVNGTVLYYGGFGNNYNNVTNVTIDSLNQIYNGAKKTIVVVGGNLYIKGDITTSSDSILGLIAITDDNGVGGNIYIDPGVTKIHATMYADKSLIGYNGTDVLDGNTNFQTLRHQLHIKGSVFSENTMGGAVQEPIRCPFYITEDCNYIEATKYDLNFLRKYHLIDNPNYLAPGDPEKIPAGSGTQSVFQHTHEYYKYPIIIEYNPIIQITPPPIFDMGSQRN